MQPITKLYSVDEDYVPHKCAVVYDVTSCFRWVAKHNYFTAQNWSSQQDHHQECLQRFSNLVACVSPSHSQLVGFLFKYWRFPVWLISQPMSVFFLTAMALTCAAVFPLTCSDTGTTVQLTPVTPSAEASHPRLASHSLPQQPMRPSATAAPRKTGSLRPSASVYQSMNSFLFAVDVVDACIDRLVGQCTTLYHSSQTNWHKYYDTFYHSITCYKMFQSALESSCTSDSNTITIPLLYGLSRCHKQTKMT